MKSSFHSAAAVLLLTSALAVAPTAAQQGTNPNFPAPPIEIVPQYPETMPAGTPFVVRLRIRNISDIPLTLQTTHHSLPLSGEHAGSFYFRRCSSDCILSGTMLTPPGEDLLVELGTLHYRNPLLFSGDVSFDGFQVSAIAESDGGDVFSYSTRVVTTEPVRVLHSSDVPEENPDEGDVPARAALELRDLAAPGDQRLLHDPNTGNDWLRLPQTTELTEESFEKAIAPDGEYAGFSVAYAAQVEQLILNHVHADGIRVHAYELSDRHRFGLRESIARFMDRIGVTQGQPSSSLYTAGAVRDRAPLSPSGTAVHTIVELHGSEEDSVFLPFNPGPARQHLAGGVIELSPRIGVWLVRAPQSLPQRPEDRASYLLENLVIPDVLVDGKHYRVHMQLENDVSSRLRLTGLDPRPASGHAVPFDAEHGTLALEDAVWLTTGEEPRHFDLQLTYLAGSEPAVFHVTRWEEQADD